MSEAVEFDFRKRLDEIQKLFSDGHHTVAAKEAAQLIEKAFREACRFHLFKLEEKDRLKIMEMEQKIGGKQNKGLTEFTMGQIAGLIRESDFIKAWGKVSGQGTGFIEMYNLDRINALRNDLVHRGTETESQEAETIIRYLEGLIRFFALFPEQLPVSAEKHQEVVARLRETEKERDKALVEKRKLEEEFRALREKMRLLEVEKARGEGSLEILATIFPKDWNVSPASIPALLQRAQTQQEKDGALTVSVPDDDKVIPMERKTPRIQFRKVPPSNKPGGKSS